MTFEDDFCDIIRKARSGHGLSIETVAADAGIPALRLQALETGQLPASGEVERLAQVLHLRQAPLRDIATGRVEPPSVTPPRAMAVTSVFAADVGAFAYAVRSTYGRIIVDCGGGVSQLLRALGGAAEAVLLTHGHSDHVAGLGDMPQGVPVFAHPELSRRLPGARPLADGETVFGLAAMHAPGHSPDMLAFHADGVAFVGDTIFAGSLGRASSSGAYQDLLASARRILALAPETVVYCGHGPATTVAWERVHNAFPVE